MGIFGSDRQPSGTLGGLLSGLFRGGNANSGASGSVSRNAGGFNRKLMGGALLAAGAAYLYNRNKGKNANLPTFDSNR